MNRERCGVRQLSSIEAQGCSGNSGLAEINLKNIASPTTFRVVAFLHIIIIWRFTAICVRRMMFNGLMLPTNLKSL